MVCYTSGLDHLLVLVVCGIIMYIFCKIMPIKLPHWTELNWISIVGWNWKDFGISCWKDTSLQKNCAKHLWNNWMCTVCILSFWYWTAFVKKIISLMYEKQTAQLIKFYLSILVVSLYLYFAWHDILHPYHFLSAVCILMLQTCCISNCWWWNVECFSSESVLLLSSMFGVCWCIVYFLLRLVITLLEFSDLWFLHQ